jgi:hypothetical protein
MKPISGCSSRPSGEEECLPDLGMEVAFWGKNVVGIWATEEEPETMLGGVVLRNSARTKFGSLVVFLSVLV